MKLDDPQFVALNDRLKPMAEQSIEAIGQVGEAAQAALQNFRVSGPDAIIPNNGISGSSPAETLRTLQIGQLDDLQETAAEPLIARVRYLDENDKVQTLYFSRRAAPSTKFSVASYRSPKGRLAALSPGEDLDIYLPGDKVVNLEVVEKAIFRPRQIGEAWDSFDTQFRDAHDFVTIRSLRALLEDGGTGDADPLALALAGDSLDGVIEGAVRNVLTRVSLRDQPVLDALQDRIFRLPVDEQLALLGPPGSGKTTTLIRRLGQKLDLVALVEEEREAIDRTWAGAVRHANSWIMFTPTALLKHYLKEAFAREGLAADDAHVKTWDEQRHDLARRVFRILRMGGGRGEFILAQTEPLSEAAVADQRPIFEAFHAWQSEDFISSLRTRAQVLERAEEGPARHVGIAIAKKLSGSKVSPATAVASLVGLSAELRKVVESQSQSLRDQLDNILRGYLRDDQKFLEKIASLLSDLSRTRAESDEEEDEFAEEEDDDQVPPQTSVIHRARTAFQRALVADARTGRTRKAPSPNSGNGRILAWLKERHPLEHNKDSLAKAAEIAAGARALLRPVRPYLFGIGKRYRRWRAETAKSGGWWLDNLSASEASNLEIDVILLAALRNAQSLLNDRVIRQRLDDSAFTSLTELRADINRNQVMVDEATDFSPVQLACMAALADSALNSLFLSGDFAQRITQWGASSIETINWAIPRISLESVTTVYRQSPGLVRFSKQLADIAEIEFEGAPTGSNGPDVVPVYGANLASVELQAGWLADRIQEIETAVGRQGEMPTIAVLVPDDASVVPLANELERALRKISVPVQACLNGEVIGQENAVRVFDIQHIKGLEFEAVFFVSVDRLAMLRPELFDRFLFVGATRAATFLGLMTEGSVLPRGLDGLSKQLGDAWP